MTIAILIISALVLPLALIYLSVAVNEFEKMTKVLDGLIQKRYSEPPKKKKAPGEPDKPMQASIVKLPGKP
jgi:hypothetical protein